MRCGKHLRAREEQSRRVGRHDERRDAAASWAGRRSGEHDVDVRQAGVGNQMLFAVDDPRCAIARGAVVRSAATSEPASGSVMANACHDAPHPMIPGSHRVRCASVPGKHDRSAAEPLQRDDRIGQRAHGGDGFADDRTVHAGPDRRSRSATRRVRSRTGARVPPDARTRHRVAPVAAADARAPQLRMRDARSTCCGSRNAAALDVNSAMVGHWRVTRTSPDACRGRPRRPP